MACQQSAIFVDLSARIDDSSGCPPNASPKSVYQIGEQPQFLGTFVTSPLLCAFLCWLSSRKGACGCFVTGHGLAGTV
jgi:hypothetical protein